MSPWPSWGLGRTGSRWQPTSWSAFDASADPVLAAIGHQHPSACHGGLPGWPDLRWPGTGVHLMGAYAGLLVGPIPRNLAGARHAAPRIADRAITLTPVPETVLEAGAAAQLAAKVRGLGSARTRAAVSSTPSARSSTPTTGSTSPRCCRARFPDADPYPTIAIPTTAGTASETDGGGLITDTSTDRKLTFTHDGARPKVVLLDPQLTVGLPPVPTATCGMDVLTHAIEALTSTNHNPLSDGLALQAIRMVGHWLSKVLEDPADLEGRAQMLLASHLAGRAFSQGPLRAPADPRRPGAGRPHHPHDPAVPHPRRRACPLRGGARRLRGRAGRRRLRRVDGPGGPRRPR